MLIYLLKVIFLPLFLVIVVKKCPYDMIILYYMYNTFGGRFMKKILGIILCGSLVLGSAGCSKKEEILTRTNGEIEEIFINDGWEINCIKEACTLSKKKDDVTNMFIINAENLSEYAYNYEDKNGKIYYFPLKDVGSIDKCIYEFQNEKAINCDDKQLKKVPDGKSNYEKVLSDLEVNRENFNGFMLFVMNRFTIRNTSDNKKAQEAKVE